MILLRANTELHQTFERLIEAMKVPVKWNGIFVVIDNYMILQGEVRSLFFHFDTRNVATNIIDIPVKEDEIGEVGTNMRVQNAINLILYAFGKWGTIKGVRVDKSFEQLNTLFTDIMKEMQVEPEYTPSYLRFYRSGMRITYEDVIQTAQVVTQMLASMEHRAVPTRADVSDIFRAVQQGAASVMLTGETAAGEYPLEAMEVLVDTVREAEWYLEERR